MLAVKEKPVMVSICCITYNQENYIAQAIESFLMQKTNFIYEILIHDDASTDNTANIVREYEKKYPDIVKPIYQTENQYSKSVVVFRINNIRANGKYIAVCEGDDYWTDPYKLQKQVDYMENHPECSLCTHAAGTVDANNQTMKHLIRSNNSDKEFSIGEVITGGGGLFATNSMFYPAKLTESMPEFYSNTPVRDYPLTIYLALQGTVHYIDQFMSVYRVQAKGSVSRSMVNNETKAIAQWLAIISMLHQVDDYTSFKYSTEINKTITEIEYIIYKLELNFKMCKDIKYKEYFSKLNKYETFVFFLACYFPNILVILKKINVLRKKIFESGIQSK